MTPEQTEILLRKRGFTLDRDKVFRLILKDRTVFVRTSLIPADNYVYWWSKKVNVSFYRVHFATADELDLAIIYVSLRRN